MYEPSDTVESLNRDDALNEIDEVFKEMQKIGSMKRGNTAAVWDAVARQQKDLKEERLRKADETDVLVRLENAKMRKAAAEARLHEVVAQTQQMREKVSFDPQEYKKAAEEETAPPAYMTEADGLKAFVVHTFFTTYTNQKCAQAKDIVLSRR